MNIPSVKKYMKRALAAKWPVLLVGHPGIGKTDICRQVAEENGCGFLVEVATTAEPTDVRGLPAVIDGQADYLPYGFLRQLLDTNKPTLVLVDDLGHAGAEVQKAFMHLLLARRVNEHKISDLVSFAAATNDIGQRAGVTGIISPLQNRVYQIRVEADPQSWCDWATAHNVSPSVIAWVRSTPTIFDDWVAPTGIEPTCTPRSTVMLSDFLQAGATSIEEFEGCIGKVMAIQFAAYLDVFNALPSVHEIVRDPSKVPIPEELDRRYGICAALACQTDQQMWDNILLYLNRLPMEMQVMCITDASNRNKEILSVPSVRNWIKINKTILL
jgi:hypothetical protein